MSPIKQQNSMWCKLSQLKEYLAHKRTANLARAFSVCTQNMSRLTTKQTKWCAPSKDSDQPGRIWVFAGCKVILLILLWGGSMFRQRAGQTGWLCLHIWMISNLIKLRSLSHNTTHLRYLHLLNNWLSPTTILLSAVVGQQTHSIWKGG